ncbi:MAG: hypothetical protein ACLQUZ_16885 [Rhizomicrobium sp.]
MNQKSLSSLAFWIVTAIALLVLFNVYPQFTARIPTVILIVPAIALLVFGFYRASRKGTLSWNKPFYHELSAKRCIILSAIFFVASLLWLFVSLSFVGHSTDELLIVVVAPVLTLTIIASIALALGLYFVNGIR